nr:MAG TPA: tail length tape measure protein [Bacteriophage sp.]
MAEQVTLLDLSFDTSGALDGLDSLIEKSLELANIKKQLNAALKDEQAQVNAAGKAFKAGAISQEEYRKIISNSTKAQTELTKQMIEVNKSISDNNAEIKVNTTLLTSQESSVNALRAQLAKNTKELNAMSAATRNNTDEGKALAAETKEISDKLKEMEKAVGDNRRNVGNYAESVQEALSNTKGLSGATGTLASSMTGAIGSVKAFSAALLANPIVAIVGIILTLISTVEKLMKRNTEMATNLKAAFAPFEVIFSRILDGITNLLTGVAKAIDWVSTKVVSLLNSIGLISDETAKAANAAKELTRAEQAIFESETDALVTLSAMSRELANQKSLVADQTKSIKERNAAANQGLSTLKQMENIEVGILKQKYEQIKAQNELSYTSADDRRKEMEALAALQSKQAEYTEKQKELISQRSSFQNQEIAKNSAAAQAAEQARAQAAIKATEEAEKRKRELQQETIKQMETALTTLDLSIKERELNNDTNATKLANQKELAEKSLEIERYRLEQGLITQQEYANRETALRLQTMQMRQKIMAEQEALDKERRAMDEANRKEIEMSEITNQYDLRQAQLDAQYAQEMAAAERLGADTTLVQQKYEKSKEELTKARVNAELTMAAGLAGQVSSLLGEESEVGKAFGVVQATINTYLGATKALAQGGILGIAQAAIVIAFGMKQVMSIAKQKAPDTKIDTSVKKYAKGGQIVGRSHAQGGVTFRGDNGQVFEAEGGENVYIMKRSASAEINALSALNEAHGGNSFGTSGLYKFADGGMVANISEANRLTRQIDNIRLSNESINQLAGVVIEAVASMPNPVVSVQDINSGQYGVAVVQNLASY